LVILAKYNSSPSSDLFKNTDIETLALNLLYIADIKLVNKIKYLVKYESKIGGLLLFKRHFLLLIAIAINIFQCDKVFQ